MDNNDGDTDGTEEPPTILLEPDVADVGVPEVPLTEPLEIGREPDVGVTEVPLIETLCVLDKDPVADEAMPDVETPEVDPPSAVFMLPVGDPRPEVDILSDEVIEVPLIGRLGLEIDTMPELELLIDESIDVPLTDMLGLLDADPIVDETRFDVTVPVVPPIALLTLAVRDPRPEADILGMDVIDVPLKEVVGLPEMIPVSEVDMLGVDRRDAALIEILGLPDRTPVIDDEMPGVEVTEVLLTDMVGLPESVPDTTESELPLAEIDTEDCAEILGMLDDGVLEGEGGDPPSVDEVSELTIGVVGEETKIEELPVEIELGMEDDGLSDELDGKAAVTVERNDVIEEIEKDRDGDDVPEGIDTDGDEKPVEEAEPVVDCNRDSDVAERLPERDADRDGEPFEPIEDPAEDP